LFADPQFDGEPVQIYEPKEKDSIVPPETEDGGTTMDYGPEDIEKPNIIYDPSDPGIGMVKEAPAKYYVSGIPVKVINERVQYYGEDGKLITESLRDYSKRNLLQEFSSLNDFLNKWNSLEKKKAIVVELIERGVLLEELEKESGKNLDPFDLICHIAFDKPPLTRKERAENVKKRNYFAKYGEQTREVLNALLDKYADTGILSIEDPEVLKVQPFTQFGSPYEIIQNIFGGAEKYEKAVLDLEKVLYSA